METRIPLRRRNAVGRNVDPLGRTRQVILAESREHGATNVRVFGSFARGTQRNTSDIDLLVEMEKGRTLLDLIALERSLGRRLGRHIDIVTERSLSPQLRGRILAEALAL
jgi:predicted nucleotidyltransferase